MEEGVVGARDQSREGGAASKQGRVSPLPPAGGHGLTGGGGVRGQCKGLLFAPGPQPPLGSAYGVHLTVWYRAPSQPRPPEARRQQDFLLEKTDSGWASSPENTGSGLFCHPF